MKKHYRDENDCLNCGTELQGHFCHVCGQPNLHVKEPFWHFISHSISHYFHFDEKFFSTLKPLLTKPGFLTQQYLEGKRTRFLHPVSMYIFVSIVYFLIVPGIESKHNGKNLDMGPVKITQNDDNANSDASADSIKTGRQNLKNVYMGGSSISNLAQKSSTKAEIKARERRYNAGFKKLPFVKQTVVIDSLKQVNKLQPSDSIKYRLGYFTNIHIAREDSTAVSYTKRQALLPEDDRDNWFENFYTRQQIEFKRKTNKDWSFTKELEHYQSKLYFILLPLLAFFIMLNFRKNHKYYVEHIVFTIHLFTAFFILEIFVKPINYFVFNTSQTVNTLMFCVIAWYVYTALRTFYQRRPWPTIRKMVTLGIMYTIAFGISLSIISAIIYLSAYLSE